MKVKSSLLQLWIHKPLTLIVWIAVIIRLVAVIFARGWGMLDDHFLVIEIAQSWVDGGNFNHWLPWSPQNDGPTGHTFVYAGFHFLLFTLFKWIHLDDPQLKMLVVRLIHAAFSMIVVVLGYRIAERWAGKQPARMAGLLLAVFWFMPWLSVRNLVEIVSIPLLFVSTWIIIKSEKKAGYFLPFLWAGLIAGISFSLRYQTLIYAGGMGLALLFQKNIRQGVIFGIGYFLAVFILQGVIDLLVWGYPFAEFIEYVSYNIEYRNAYITGDWYNYLIFLFGILIPPVSVFLFVGLFKNWKKRLLIFLPVLIFLAFHSYFPNKQERFILTIVPFLIVLGAAGWYELSHSQPFLMRYRKIFRGGWVFFWIINLILLFPVTTMYSKRAKVEAMSYLYKYENVKAILLENTNGTSIQIMPQFYLGEWIQRHELSQAKPLEKLPDFARHPELEPRFVLFFRDDKLEARVKQAKVLMPQLEFEAEIEPGFVDKVLHWLNPHNVNETIYIYRNARYF